MTLQQIKYLINIAEIRSINKASEKLYIAQPALTEAIKEVEREIGIKIFHRTHKGVIPTVEGQEFLLHIKKLYTQYEKILDDYSAGKKYKKKFAISMQHYSFAVKAFIKMASQYDSNQFELAIRETKTIDVIKDVSFLKSEIGIIYISDMNKNVILKLFKENELDFHPLIECSPCVYLYKKHPLANKKKLTFKDLDSYPCLSFEQGSDNEIFFAEEILIEHAYKKTIKATDRATMMNLMIGLNGYTLCSSIYSDELSLNQFIVIPFKFTETTKSKMTIGYIVKKNWELSNMCKKFLYEVDKELNTIKTNIKDDLKCKILNKPLIY